MAPVAVLHSLPNFWTHVWWIEQMATAQPSADSQCPMMHSVLFFLQDSVSQLSHTQQATEETYKGGPTVSPKSLLISGAKNEPFGHGEVHTSESCTFAPWFFSIYFLGAK